MVRLIVMEQDFIDKVDAFVLQALETHREQLIPLFIKSYDCSARCYEESKSLDDAAQCAQPCSNEAKRLGAELHPWIESYSKHLSLCKAECDGKDLACFSTCLTHKKEDPKLLAQLAFIVKAFFTFS
jgi:hypothetical protein